MFARLVALGEGPDILLGRGLMIIGRHPGCDTRLNFPRVSRHHCCLSLEDGELWVKDLGSTNGIRINGLAVEIGRLKDGDELTIANLRFRFENGSLFASRFSHGWPSAAPPLPPTDYPRPSDPKWPWVRRAGWDLEPPRND